MGKLLDWLRHATGLRLGLAPLVEARPEFPGEPEYRLIYIHRPVRSGWIVERRDNGGEWEQIPVTEWDCAWFFPPLATETLKPTCKQNATMTVRDARDAWRVANVAPVRGEVVRL